MFWIFLAIILIVLAVVSPVLLPKKSEVLRDEETGERYKKVTPIKPLVWGVRTALGFLAIVSILSTSFVFIDKDEVGMLDRVYLAKSLPPDRVIAIPGYKGPQAEILGPGFNFRLLLNVLYDVKKEPIVEIQQGTCGYLIAKDGAPLRDGQFIGDELPRDKMINALWFMGSDLDEWKPRGQKGPQLAVLPPGKYRINRYLFDILEMQATDIPVGYVGVIKSNVGEQYTGEPILPTGVEFTNLSVPIVPKGYRGVWNTVLKPDRYYLNLEAYNVTPIATQIQTWKYLGGYTRRFIDLEVADDGQIKQKTRSQDIQMPDDAADQAVLLKVEGWECFQDARIQVQVTPENAPFVVAAAGGLPAIEDKIITPTLRSVLRNEVAKEVEEKREIDGETKIVKRPRKVLDLLYRREATEQVVEQKLIPEGAKVGLTVMEVRFGDPVVPPELLLPQKREQLAQQLKRTYQEEKKAQEERVLAMRERARADQQPELMQSEIGKQVAANEAEQARLRGKGEKDYKELVAQGLRAEATVLGQDKAYELAKFKLMLEAAVQNPNIVKQPNTLVIGGDGAGLTGAAAVLGANNISLGSMEKATKTKKE